MKFWCGSSNSSKQRKTSNKKPIKPNDSLSSSPSYASISSIEPPKSDSGYSETASDRATTTTSTYLEQIHFHEKIFFENLRNFIIKYSRPLRRFLNHEEIVQLFQNIEKICTISESINRQCKRLIETDPTNSSISAIYQSLFTVMYDSYRTYISGNLISQSILKQCEDKIAYFLQISIEFVREDLREFIQLPLQHICLLNDLFQSLIIDYSGVISHLDLKIIQDIGSLAKQADHILQSSDELKPIVVLQRSDKHSWQSKRLELTDCFLILTDSNRSSNINLCNILQIEQDLSNHELHLIIASSTISKYSQYASIKMKNIYIRFQERTDYIIWHEYLTYAIQQAKDQIWSKTNELVI